MTPPDPAGPRVLDEPTANHRGRDAVRPADRKEPAIISRVRKFVVPVDDEAYGDERWIEVTPPDRSLILVLSLGSPEEPRREVPDELAHSDLIFTCDDLQQTYQELTERGVRFPAPPTRMPFGW